MVIQTTKRLLRRPGSILILVIAVLAVLALAGTIFINNTQADRPASRQNSINTEADLLMQGLVSLTQSVIPNGLYGTSPTGRRLRAPSQEMPLPSASSPSGYSSAVSPDSEMMLADRIPGMSADNGQISWGHISWPLVADGNGQYQFESPFGETVPLYSQANKRLLEIQPVARMLQGKTLPAVSVFLPPANVSQFVPALPTNAAGYYLTPNGPIVAGTLTAGDPRLSIFAGSAAGDGIADSGLWKVPVGPLNGITYFAAVKIIDQNSAINASTAWRGDIDPTGTNTSATIQGYFRANMGLQELLGPETATKEIDAFNQIRFGKRTTVGISANMAESLISMVPHDDAGNARADFQYTSYGDALDSQLARRPTLPGLNGNNSPFAAMNVLDCAAVASRFSLLSLTSGASQLENCFASELLNYPNARTTPYAANQIADWYNDLFNYDPTFSTSAPTPLRSLLVASNPVSNAIESRFGFSEAPPDWSSEITYQFGDWVIGQDGRSYVALVYNSNISPVLSPSIGGIEYWAAVPWSTTPVKASANTATFEQLYLAYCHVMTDSQTTATSSTAAQWQPPMMPAGRSTSPETQLPMFRSVVRDNRAWPITQGSLQRTQLTPMQMMQLRAGIAAVNTLQIRQSSDVRTAAASHYDQSRHIVLSDLTGEPAYDVELFSADVQPYILSMYAHTSSSRSQRFIALQLVNPFPVAIAVTSSWCFATIDRSLMPAMSLTPVSTATPPFIIPAASSTAPGVITLEDGFPPQGFKQPSSVVNIPGLVQAIGKELIILRTRRLDGTPSSTITGTQSAESFNESTNPYDLVPVDQLDMTGTDRAPQGSNLYYRRAADPAIKTTAGLDYNWNFVWPGRYDPYCKFNETGPTSPPSYMPVVLPSSYPFFQQIVIGPAPKDKGTINPDFSKLFGGTCDTTAKSPTAPTYSTITLQLGNSSLLGPASINTINRFPFGGFARNGDLLQVPYIGAYRIVPFGQSAADSIVEMNSVTMDCSLADDQTLIASGTAYPSKVVPSTATDSLADPFVEQLGRFCPIGDTQPTHYEAAVTGHGQDTSALLDFGNDPTLWHYHWTKKLFNYLTVQAPHDDYFPNVDPANEDKSISPSRPAPYLPTTDPSGNPLVLPVANQAGNSPNSQIAGESEDTTGVEGLVNINTAPWRVLSLIPWLPRGTDTISDNADGGDGVDDNINLARAIVNYRNLNGPFNSIEDLYSVPAFRLANDRLILSNLPTSSLTSASLFGFADRFCLLSRASNLITTRSDTFTCYILLQGWRNAGTTNATLAVERRAAFFADRNDVRAGSPNATTFKVPTN